MELRLTFSHGRIRGDGRDRIGTFTFAGTYDVRDGTCHWTKRYVGQHAVAYRGYNEGKGIWGVWDIPPRMRGGFHIWRVGMSDPTAQAEVEHVEEPLVVTRGASRAGPGDTTVAPFRAAGRGACRARPSNANGYGCRRSGGPRGRVGRLAARGRRGGRLGRLGGRLLLQP